MAKPASCSWIVKSVVIFLLIVILLILLLPRSHESLKETFTSGPSTGVSSLTKFKSYQDSNDTIAVKMNAFDKDLKDSRTFSDQHALLQTKRCYQFELKEDTLTKSLMSLQKAKVVIRGQSIEGKSATVENTVLQILKKFKKEIGGRFIKGPVFVILSQEPFYRDEKCGLMPIQYYLSDYLFKPINIFVEDKKHCTQQYGEPQVVIHVACILPAYEDNRSSVKRRIIPNVHNKTLEQKNDYLEKIIINRMKNAEVIKDYCFMECLDEPDISCGCYTSDKKIHSACIAPKVKPKNDADKMKVTKSHFMMLYSVNKNNRSIIENSLMK